MSDQEIHCSACDSVVSDGAQFCAGCGLRLTAQANQAVYIEKGRFPIFGTIGIALVAIILLIEILK